MTRNTLALLLVQASNYIAPLLVIPHLGRALGVEGYGHVAFGIAVVQTLLLVVSFGFPLTAPADIAKLPGRQQRDCLATEILVAQAMLLLAGLVAMLLLASTFEGDQRMFIFALLPALIGFNFQTLWYFQGLEQLGWVTYYAVATKLSYVGMVYVLVRKPSDLVLVGVAYSVAALLGMFASLSLMRRLGFAPQRVSVSGVFAAIARSAPYFLSRSAVALYTTGALVLLGSTATAKETGQFALGQQFYMALQIVPTVLVLVVLPVASRTRDPKLVLRLSVALGIFGICSGIVFIWAAPVLVPLVGGSSFDGSGGEFKLLMIAYMITAWSTMLGYPFAASVGSANSANFTTYLGAIAFVFSVAWLLASSQVITALSVAACVVIAEGCVGLSRLVVVFDWKSRQRV